MGNELQCVSPSFDFERNSIAYLSVDNPCSNVNVANIIAELMVARIVPVSCLSTKHLSLLLRFDTLSTSGNATTGNTIADETIIVTTTVKGDECVVQTLVFVPLDVKIAKFL